MHPYTSWISVCNVVTVKEEFPNLQFLAIRGVLDWMSTFVLSPFKKTYSKSAILSIFASWWQDCNLSFLEHFCPVQEVTYPGQSMRHKKRVDFHRHLLKQCVELSTTLAQNRHVCTMLRHLFPKIKRSVFSACSSLVRCQTLPCPCQLSTRIHHR